MKLVHKNMGHLICFKKGYVNELIIENRALFFTMVNDIFIQSEGISGGFVLSVNNKPVEFSRYADVTVQFAPFEINQKSLLTKLYSRLEKTALQAENYTKTGELLNEIEKYIYRLAEDLPFELCCSKVTISQIIKALAPEINEKDKGPLEQLLDYMELVRELDKDRLFIMINMRTYFSDADMETFIQSICLHDLNVLLLESISMKKLSNTQRFTIDEDLCEF